MSATRNEVLAAMKLCDMPYAKAIVRTKRKVNGRTARTVHVSHSGRPKPCNGKRESALESRLRMNRLRHILAAAAP